MVYQIIQRQVVIDLDYILITKMPNFDADRQYILIYDRNKRLF